ncbi:unnamed protein product [Bubo scandiacus]
MLMDPLITNVQCWQPWSYLDQRFLQCGQVDHRTLLKDDSVLFGVFIIHIELVYIQAISQEKNSGFTSTVGSVIL